ELEYYKENEDELSLRRVEPYALTNGREGWYLASFDPERDGVRHFRLDRIKRAAVTGEKFEPRPEVDPAAEVDGWLRTGEVQASRTARVWVSPDRARGAAGGGGAAGRGGRRGAGVRGRRLAGPRDRQGRRRGRCAGAAGRPRGRSRGGRAHTRGVPRARRQSCGDARPGRRTARSVR